MMGLDVRGMNDRGCDIERPDPRVVTFWLRLKEKTLRDVGSKRGIDSTKENFCMKRPLVVLAATSLVACGGGAVLNQQNNEVQTETEFCGVSVKFSGKTRSFTKYENDEIAKVLGNFDNFNITGLYFDKYQLEESMACICRSVVTKKFLINPNYFENVKQSNIGDVGMVTYYENNESLIMNRYQYIIPINDSSCQILQSTKSLSSSPYKSSFFDSLSLIRLKSNSSVTSTIKERLIQLDILKKDGLITQSEYDGKRK